jgi:hypothetical protein
MATSKTESEVVIVEMARGVMDFCVLGTSPLICNRMAQKARMELLAPKGRKTTAEKASNAKHDPMQEYRDSPYRMASEAAPTALAVLPTMFKQSMASAALDMPGTKKAQIGRLVSVDWDRMPLFGVPKLFMAVTRSADMNKTPDVRTRAIVPEWACRLTVSFMKPVLREQSIVNLLAAAGQLSGIGDWRQQKGSGGFGAFKLVSADDPDFVRITTQGGRAAQLAALEDPDPYDDETSELMSWFGAEMKRRGFKVAA